MFLFRFDFATVLICFSLGQTSLFTEANQDGYDKCLFFRTISSMNFPSKWDPSLGPYRQINDSESESDLPIKLLRSNMGKRSLSTLAKNDDMPATHFQEGHNNRESSDVSLRFDDADKNGPSKVSKYLQQVKRRSSSALRDETEPSNMHFYTKDYIVCNDDNEQAGTYEAQVDERLAALQDKFQDADFLSAVLNGLNSEQAAPTTQSFYPRMDKRFMGRIPEMGPRLTTPPTRRHGR